MKHILMNWGNLTLISKELNTSIKDALFKIKLGSDRWRSTMLFERTKLWDYK